MEKHIGIPTLYNGTEYRSRLESKWACFFDLCGWKHQYEPFDLDGWIPDFVLYGKREILVEVKPFSSFEEFDPAKYMKAKLGTEKENNEILLLGSTIHKLDDFQDAAFIGWLGEKYDDSEDCFGEAVMNRWNGVYGFIHADGSWEDRITGLYDGDHYLALPPYEEINKLWGRSGNSVKWTPKGGR